MGLFKEEDLTKYEKLSGVETVTATAQTRAFCNAELNSNINEAVEKLTDMGIEIVNVNQTPIIANGITYYGTATITWKRSQKQLDEIKRQKEEKLNQDYSYACSLQSSGNYEMAKIYFSELPSSYKDVSKRIDECYDKIEEKRVRIEKETKRSMEIAYNNAKLLIDTKEYQEAYKLLTIVTNNDKNYKDVKRLIRICSENDDSIRQEVKENKKKVMIEKTGFTILSITILALIIFIIYLIFFSRNGEI